MEIKDMKNLNDIAKQIKDVESGVNNMIIPLLKDTISDANNHNKRMFIIVIICLIIIALLGVFAQLEIAKQSKDYADFLSQFEFETVGDIGQTINADNGSNATINDGINIHK